MNQKDKNIILSVRIFLYSMLIALTISLVMYVFK